MESMLEGLHPAARERIMRLWREYEDRSSPEAKLVKDFDRFEMALQADDYERAGSHADLSEFFASVRGKLVSPNVREWLEVVERDRRKRRRGS